MCWYYAAGSGQRAAGGERAMAAKRDVLVQFDDRFDQNVLAGDQSAF